MNVGQLKSTLEGIDDDMEVRVFADHGQSCMKASSVDVQQILFADKDEYMPETVHPSEIDPEEKYIDVFEVYAG